MALVVKFFFGIGISLQLRIDVETRCFDILMIQHVPNKCHVISSSRKTLAKTVGLGTAVQLAGFGKPPPMVENS